MDVLNYNHLYYFWTVARHGSVRGASEELGLSQPTVSEQMHKLEETLGVKLFERAGRGLLLSPNGQLLLRYAEPMFRIGREMHAALAGAEASGSVPRLAVGITQEVPALLAHQWLAATTRACKGLRLHCVEDRLEALAARLAQRQVDVILSAGPLPEHVPVRAHSRKLCECGVSFLTARTIKGSFPRSLDGALLLMPAPDSALRRALERWLEKSELRPVVAGEFGGSTMRERFAQQGAGVLAVATAVERETRNQYGLELLGRTEQVRLQFHAITLERSVPPVVETLVRLASGAPKAAKPQLSRA